MSTAPRASSTRLSLAVVIVAVASLITAFAVSAASSSNGPVKDREVSSSQAQVVPGGYIVQLAEKPVVAYDGGIPGHPATKPAKGNKIDPDEPNVKSYVAFLDSRHDAVLARVGGGKKLYDYRYAYNGFAAKLSAAQAATLQKLPGVKSVEPIMEAAPDTSTTPTFLGLTGPTGLWAQLGGPSGPSGAGENIVVGMLDTGIWPEHPSVSDRVDGKKVYKPLSPKDYHGKCVSSETVTDGSWDANLCNQKLVGARFFIETFDQFATLAPNDFRSPRDSDGHGTHTSTTAAGNFGIEPTGVTAGFGAISGMAPRARIATYKVCWDDGNPATGGCFTSDSAAAMDQAVADGVDVVNFSISGTSTSFLHVVEVAAFNAADAGVFVAMSAGNTGPGAGTVNHPSPWLTTVGASTHNRPAAGKVTLGNGSVFTGASQAKTTISGDLIHAEDAGLATANPNLLRQCFSESAAAAVEPAGTYGAQLDPAKVANKIVICERGGPTAPAAAGNARVDKSKAVQDAGGKGMILINAAPNTLNADVHFVPTVHLADTTLSTIKAYSKTTGATAMLGPDPSVTTVPAPVMGSFSSRGPSLATGDQLKPDVTAPGVDVLAGFSPASLLTPGRLFDIVSGTSMSSPHVAGIGALLKQAHPNWTPAMIKSALMTTGTDVLGSFPSNSVGSADANRAFAQGAGHIKPTSAANPGLVYNNGAVDWLRFICGTGQLAASQCTPFGGPIDPSDLNLASIAIGDLAGTQTVTRTVTSVSSASETYTASASVPGMNAVVTPSVFTIAPGGTQTFTIDFTRTTAALGPYQSGFLTLTSSSHTVRSPIVVRPVPIRAPAEVDASSGAATWDIKSGVAETITLNKRGLAAGTETFIDDLPDDPDNSFNTGAPDDPSNLGVFKKEVTVPSGQSVLRFATFDANTDGNDDVDLYLYSPTGVFTAISGGPTSEEVITINNPAAGTWKLYVHGFETDGPSADLTLYHWILGSGTADAGNMSTNGPFAATIGSTHTVNLTTSGLATGGHYVGQIVYSGSTTPILGTSIVRANP